MIIDNDWLEQAVRLIVSGVVNKLTNGNTTVYKYKNIVRIDIKIDESYNYDDYMPNDFNDLSLIP